MRNVIIVRGEPITLALEESALDGVVTSTDRRLVGCRCVGDAAHAPQQVRPNRMKQSVVTEIKAVELENRGQTLTTRGESPAATPR